MKDFVMRHSFGVVCSIYGLLFVLGITLGELSDISWFKWLWVLGVPLAIWQIFFSKNFICVCSNCGKKIFTKSERYCWRCGGPTLIKRKIRKMKICSNGHRIEDEWDSYQMCPKCGKPLQLIEVESSLRLSKKMEEQKRKEERERKKIGKLISETEGLIEEIILQIKNPEFLAALKLIELELSQILQRFNDKEISYQEAEESVLNLQEQARILSFAPSEEKTYYQILGVSEDASQEEIKRSFREKIIEYHPDQQSPESKEWVKKMADEMAKKLTEAYNILGDPKKRREYDEKIGIRR